MNNIIDLVNNKCIFNDNELYMLIDKDNNPWFKGKDIAKILEYENSNEALKYHVKDKYKVQLNEIKKGSNLLPSHPHTIFINEAGLYQLIMKSKMNKADEFQDWVFEEVLPSIRKYGIYKINNELEIKYKENLAIKDKEIESKDKIINKKKHDIVCKQFDSKKLHEFVLINKNHLWEYQYYVIRAQRKESIIRLKELKHVYPEYEILLRFSDPNSINLYNQIKESINVIHHGNHFQSNLNESELISEICKLNYKKLNNYLN